MKFEVEWVIRGKTKVDARDAEEAKAVIDMQDFEKLLEDAEPLEIEEVWEK